MEKVPMQASRLFLRYRPLRRMGHFIGGLMIYLTTCKGIPGFTKLGRRYLGISRFLWGFIISALMMSLCTEHPQCTHDIPHTNLDILPMHWWDPPPMHCTYVIQGGQWLIGTLRFIKFLTCSMILYRNYHVWPITVRRLKMAAHRSP